MIKRNDAAQRPRRCVDLPIVQGYFCQEGFCVGVGGLCAGAAGFGIVTGAGLAGVVELGLAVVDGCVLPGFAGCPGLPCCCCPNAIVYLLPLFWNVARRQHDVVAFRFNNCHSDQPIHALFHRLVEPSLPAPQKHFEGAHKVDNQRA